MTFYLTVFLYIVWIYIALYIAGMTLMICGIIWNSCEVTDPDEIAAYADSFRVSAHEQKEKSMSKLEWFAWVFAAIFAATSFGLTMALISGHCIQ